MRGDKKVDFSNLINRVLIVRFIEKGVNDI